MATTEARPAARAAPRDPGLRAALTRPAVLVPVLVGLAAAIATAAASAAALARTLPVEDAFYALAVSRNVALGRKTLQLRIDVANLLNRDHFSAPNLNPASAQFGTVTSNPATLNRFVTFITKLTFWSSLMSAVGSPLTATKSA